MRFGASVSGFFHHAKPETWPSLAGAVDEILAVDDTLGVEIWGARGVDQPQVCGQDLVDLAAACREAAFVTTHVQGRHWSWNARHLRDEIDLAHRLGAEMLVLHPICFGLVQESDRPDWPEIVRIAGYANKFGVRLAMENTRDTLWALDRILDELGDDPEETNLSICVDVGHAHVSEDAGREPVVNYIERYADQLLHVHLHDNRGTADEHLGLGEGTIDWHRALAALDQIGFEKTAVLEFHPLQGESMAVAIEEALKLLGS